VRDAHNRKIIAKLQTKDNVMPAARATSLTPEHQDFYERFKSYWAAPTGLRTAELIAPDATIHFSGVGTFSATQYIDIMQRMIDSMVDLKVTPLDCAGNGELLYIFWETSALVDGAQRIYLGVDRFRLANGMAIEEHVIFDTAALKLSS
jgi:hypothetical protein